MVFLTVAAGKIYKCVWSYLIYSSEIPDVNANRFNGEYNVFFYTNVLVLLLGNNCILTLIRHRCLIILPRKTVLDNYTPIIAIAMIII